MLFHIDRERCAGIRERLPVEIELFTRFCVGGCKFQLTGKAAQDERYASIGADALGNAMCGQRTHSPGL